MAAEKIPTTVSQLLATAAQAVENTEKHRTAMAAVAAQVRARPPAPVPTEGVTK